MILNLHNVLKEKSLPFFNTFTLGVDLLKNHTGKEVYPLLHVELPMKFEKVYDTNTGGLFVANISFYSLARRLDKTHIEELNNLDNTFKLAEQFVNSLNEPNDYLVMSVEKANYLSYSGIELAEFSDDLDGFRCDLMLVINYSLC